MLSQAWQLYWYNRFFAWLYLYGIYIIWPYRSNGWQASGKMVRLIIRLFLSKYTPSYLIMATYKYMFQMYCWGIIHFIPLIFYYFINKSLLLNIVWKTFLFRLWIELKYSNEVCFGYILIHFDTVKYNDRLMQRESHLPLVIIFNPILTMLTTWRVFSAGGPTDKRAYSGRRSCAKYWGQMKYIILLHPCSLSTIIIVVISSHSATSVNSMLGHRRRRWPSIELTLAQCVVLVSERRRRIFCIGNGVYVFVAMRSHVITPC